MTLHEFNSRQLCHLVDVEELFRTISEELLNIEDAVYRRRVVDLLNNILLTSLEAFELRARLRTMETNVVHTMAMCFGFQRSHLFGFRRRGSCSLTST